MKLSIFHLRFEKDYYNIYPVVNLKKRKIIVPGNCLNPVIFNYILYLDFSFFQTFSIV